MKQEVRTLAKILTGLTVIGGFGYVYAQGSLEDQKARLVQELTETVLNELNVIKGKIELRYDLGEEVLEGEQAAITQATNAVVKTTVNRAFDGDTPGLVKGDHGKELACLDGTMSFKAEEDFNDDEKHLIKGVVAPGKSYDLEVRLSNAEDHSRIDRASTSQGVALKLKNVSSVIGQRSRLPDFPSTDEQDFLMTSARTFFLPNIMRYADVFSYRADHPHPSIVTKMAYFIPRFFWLKPRADEEKAAQLRVTEPHAPGRPESVLSHPYWSKHPYAWGEANEVDQNGEELNAVKYSVEPCSDELRMEKISNPEDKDYQIRFLTAAFGANGQICYNFRVQTRPASDRGTIEEQRYPIENASVEWNETETPFKTIGQIILKGDSEKNREWIRLANEFLAGKSKTEFAALQGSCGQTEFSPWNGLLAHQPLSNIARGRRDVYKASALVRKHKAEYDERIRKILDRAE